MSNKFDIVDDSWQTCQFQSSSINYLEASINEQLFSLSFYLLNVAIILPLFHYFEHFMKRLFVVQGERNSKSLLGKK